MLDRLGQAGKERMARKFMESEQADALLTILTEAEDSLLEAVEDQHDALDLDELPERPSPEDRRAVIREALLATLSDDFPAWWVEHMTPLDHADEAAEFADLDADAWQDQVETWADRLRDRGREGSDRDLAGAFVTARYGVDLDGFERVVVEWPEGRQGDHLQELIAGGVETALDGIERSTAEIRDRLDDVDQPEASG